MKVNFLFAFLSGLESSSRAVGLRRSDRVYVCFLLPVSGSAGRSSVLLLTPLKIRKNTQGSENGLLSF